MSQWGRRGLAVLAIAAACLGRSPSSHAQAAPEATSPGGVRVVTAAPTGETIVSVTEATIRFSEPMVPLGGLDVDRVTYVHVEPAIAVTFRWPDTNVLVVTPRAGRFPYATSVTVRVDAGATAMSGRRLAAPYAVSFATPAPRLLSVQLSPRSIDGKTVFERPNLFLHFDQPVRVRDLERTLAAEAEPVDFTVPPLSPEARERMARVDPHGLRRRDAWAAAMTVRQPTRLRLAASAGSTDGEYFTVACLDTPPPGVRVAVTHTGASSPEGPRTRETPDRVLTAVRPVFSVSGPRCDGLCDPDRIALDAGSADLSTLPRSMTVTDITPGMSESVLVRGDLEWTSMASFMGLRFLGYRLEPGHRYAIYITGAMSFDAQPQAAPWMSIVDVGRRSSLAALGTSTHTGVWEAALGTRVPVLTRNLQDVLSTAIPVPPAAIARALAGEQRAAVPDPTSTPALSADDDTVAETFVDVSKALSPAGTGVIRLDVATGTDVPGTVKPLLHDRRSDAFGFVSGSLIQVTNIGLSVRGNQAGLAILASRLDTGEPLADTGITVVDAHNGTLWKGRTDADGLARATPLGTAEAKSTPHVVVAERGGDTAFASVPHVSWGMPDTPSVVGVLWTDRGVYRPGEAVHVKAYLRLLTPQGLRPVPEGTPVTLTLVRGDDAQRQFTGRVTAFGSADWEVPIPEDSATDASYALTVTRGAPDATLGDYDHDRAELTTGLLIKAVRPVEFRTSLAADAVLSWGPPAIEARVTARDLSDVALSQARVEWTLTRGPLELPALLQADPEFRFGWGDETIEQAYAEKPYRRRATGTIDATGELPIRFQLPEGLSGRGTFTVAAQVRDTSSQVQGTSAVAVVPAEAYLGVGRERATARGAGAAIRLVARTPSGALLARVAAEVAFFRSEGDTDAVARVKLRTGEGPVRVPIPASLRDEDAYVEVRATDERRAIMPVKGWLRHLTGPDWSDAADSSEAPDASGVPRGRIFALTLDRQHYQPGDRARLRIATVFPTATALVTLERGAVLAAYVVRITDGAGAVDLPVGDSALDGLTAYVNVIRGRTSLCCSRGLDDPGQPSAYWDQIVIPVERESTQLTVAIEPPKGARPGATTTIRVRVRDRDGRPARAEVTLWAVDEGVLALTNYQLRDPAATIYRPIWGTLWWTETRAWILARKLPFDPSTLVQTSMAERTSARGGGEPTAVGEDAAVRKDLRPLAFWSAAVPTTADGTAEITATLPDTLTTYRVMAVAADAEARFGHASAPMLVNTPVMVRPSMPRFLTRGDRADLRSIVAATGVQGTGSIVMESLTPTLLRVDAQPKPIAVADGSRTVASSTIEALGAGTARLRVTATVAGIRDVIERDLPIVDGSLPETAAAVGEASPEAVETLRPPLNADPAAGGLQIELASSMLVGLSAAAGYVTTYPYACGEQTASRALVLVLAAALGPGFTPAESPTAADDRRAAAQRALDDLAAYRCDGGYAYGYWRGECRMQSPYLTTYILFVLETAARHGFAVPAEVRAEGIRGVENALVSPPAPGGATDDTAWRAFAVKVLVDAGRRPAAAIDALYAQRGLLPIFAIGHLFDALQRIEPASARVEDLRRRLRNATTAGATAHVEERSPARCAWCWPSNAKTTAIVLEALARTGGVTREEAGPMAAWLLAERRRGVWTNTQENVWALIALEAYRRAFEPTPDRRPTATVSLEGHELLRLEPDAQVPSVARTVTMPELARLAALGAPARLTVASSGSPIFYATRLAYRVPAREALPFEHGIQVTRTYVPVVHGVDGKAATRFGAGDLVRVVLSVRVSQSRTFVAVSDTLPGGFEVVDTSLATSSVDGADDDAQAYVGPSYWSQGFDRIERHDQRVDLFATSLPIGTHQTSYLARATTPGTFFAAPARAEAMYEPEVAGRSAGETIVVKPAP